MASIQSCRRLHLSITEQKLTFVPISVALTNKYLDCVLCLNRMRIYLFNALEVLKHHSSSFSELYMRLPYKLIVIYSHQQDVTRLPGLESRVSKISIIDGVSGIIKPGRYANKTFLLVSS